MAAKTNDCRISGCKLVACCICFSWRSSVNMRGPPRSVLAIDCYLVHILPFERNVMFFRTFSEVTEYNYILSAVFLLY